MFYVLTKHEVITVTVIDTQKIAITLEMSFLQGRRDRTGTPLGSVPPWTLTHLPTVIRHSLTSCHLGSLVPVTWGGLAIGIPQASSVIPELDGHQSPCWALSVKYRFPRQTVRTGEAVEPGNCFVFETADSVQISLLQAFSVGGPSLDLRVVGHVCHLPVTDRPQSSLLWRKLLRWVLVSYSVELPSAGVCLWCLLMRWRACVCGRNSTAVMCSCGWIMRGPWCWFSCYWGASLLNIKAASARFLCCEVTFSFGKEFISWGR